jgi:hypothetical protein
VGRVQTDRVHEPDLRDQGDDLQQSVDGARAKRAVRDADGVERAVLLEAAE